MSAYALGALVAYKPAWCPPDAVDGWLTTPHKIIAIRTYRHIERPVQIHYTVLPATGDATDWWHLRPIALVRADQLRHWPCARCVHCGTGLPLAQLATPVAEACHECTVWWQHLQAQAATEDAP